jgi:hypothetical protein
MRPRIIIALVNLLYAVLLVIVFALLPRVHPQPIQEIRSRLESASTLEELQRRSSAAGSALEAADKSIVNLYEVITYAVILGVTWAALNTALTWLLFRQTSPKV